MIHLKNNSTCQRDLYNCVMVKRRQVKIVGQEDKRRALDGIDEADAAEGVGIVFGGAIGSQNYGLIRT